jgi:hypothetical protein
MLGYEWDMLYGTLLISADYMDMNRSLILELLSYSAAYQLGLDTPPVRPLPTDAHKAKEQLVIQQSCQPLLKSSTDLRTI